MKNIKYFFLFIFFFLLFPYSCMAVTEYVRTPEELRVPSDVEVENDRIPEILRTPSVDEHEKIYDFANLLTELEEEELYKSIIDFIDATGIDALVVTTKDLRGFTISQYTYHFYDYNDFSNEGVIFVIYINEKDKPEIFMGNSGSADSKVFKVYHDDNIKAILKYIFNKHISKEEYYEACRDYFTIIKGLYTKTFGNYTVDEEGKVVTNIPWLYITLISFTVTFIIVIIIISQSYSKLKKNDYTLRNGLDSDNIILKRERDEIVQGTK